MRMLPRSLAGRLLVTAAFAIAAALALASIAIGHVLERFVIGGLDQRLDAQLAVIARAVRPDGSIDPARTIDVPPFDRPGSGWAWQINAPGGSLRAASLAGRSLLPERSPHRRPPPPMAPYSPRDDGAARPFEGRGPDGAAVHGRRLIVPTAAGPVELLAAGPRWVVERPLRAALTPLLLSDLLLGVGLTLAVLLQLRLGLRPLDRLRAMLHDVRAGRRRHVVVDEPTELLPLVAELNALIDANDAGLSAARLHVANLAHGLKTPLATLRLALAEPGRDPDGSLTTQISRLERQVHHHLALARAGDRGTAAAPRIPLRPVIDDLADAMRRLHADSGVSAHVAVGDGLAVRCDPQDLDEAIGNLLDNAWRHARHAVAIAAADEGRVVRLTIVDDGDGLGDATLADLQAGTVRLDEHAAGYGQGIRIARQLIELHNGRLAFARGDAGGLSVEVVLPAGQA